MTKSALLVLENGTKFYGKAIGARGTTVGEVVFNTSMTGYQEILSDPSYFHQIVTLTYPHIGNTGTNEIDNESLHVQAQGLVIRDLPILTSNFRSSMSLSEYLERNNIIGISDIDTRKLTRLLREEGTQNGCIIAGDPLNTKLALCKAREFPGLNGIDLAKEVSTTQPYIWNHGSWNLNQSTNNITNAYLPYHVVVYDYGIKRNIMRMLVDRGCRLTVVPAQTTADTVLAMYPDGILLANGPGDPAPCDYAITAIQQILTQNIPIFGICFGHQLLAIASGAKTFKMKFGHHGSNHPVKDLTSGRIFITSQNHSFAVDKYTLPDTIRITHTSLFDGTLQGLHLTDKPAFSFQGHPEASPGPQDITLLFDYFIKLIILYRSQHN
ncbi:glutamine-hydrolyzing carbamoyl-phosphate synthase small subunit [Candidatus Palibaumannia cicadellinicola]|uniref:Carbamoyl phosphate synthase small chain n=1 Tax=Baumannia cicadellinicola subsp. Homalodisca coagulata TaxID=374463 RepID=Q1LSS6_BAUCH|nr:glutamine-hydrolyzing carbamoyl-phosphate synthase small subunit [Candidatus Baumannia cicadellinicola]ABF14053.1 carbamoyl-phosphate synthase, small subunit [Baumannia cicadellinicola str. Hc (Homalodisca coagulata)]MBS0032892.1 glutamine-hydrolyzing carbamoyl-phosphate synthase small subunit [Candidatus Baumannia cicadellinicola]MCJ7462150.1 glutamine-hydrolyzing carbamoyl-phosphate synthase small subunit [Candidatus Baumannia cicadellinicola]MCJ7462987.1 glutamine-hydrolyzing carbamoyl-ph